MIRVAIYNLSGGRICRLVTAHPSNVDIQLREGEEFYLNPPDWATHIIDGVPITQEIVLSQPSCSRAMVGIREKRNAKLSACDWIQLPDAPLNQVQKAAWATYRQALRDFPATCDPYNPVWPEAPR